MLYVFSDKLDKSGCSVRVLLFIAFASCYMMMSKVRGGANIIGVLLLLTSVVFAAITLITS